MKTEKPKYIINFTVCNGIDEPKVLYFYDRLNAMAVYGSLLENDVVVDLYFSEVTKECLLENK